jgi:hypothetical protein
MTRPQGVDGGDGLQMCKVAANIMNKQSQTADKGGTPARELGVGLKTHHKKITLLQMLCRVSDLDWFFAVMIQAKENGNEVWYVIPIFY